MPQPRVTVPAEHGPDYPSKDLADAKLPADGVVEVHDDDDDILDADQVESK